MRRLRILVLPGLLLLLSLSLLAQTKSSVFGTSHDISGIGGGCKGCHVPHQQSAKGEALLWAQNFPTTATFGVYTSPTMNTAAQEVGANYSATNAPTGAKSYTVLCLSCHDGLTSPTVISAFSSMAIANPNPATSDGLKNDHPVNLPYNATADAGLEPLATVQASAVRLFSDGTNQTVQCGSCHDVHNNSNTHFLRVANSNSKAGLCTVCHK
jgi:predicted CXXCH cytochrome family protein